MKAWYFLIILLTPCFSFILTSLIYQLTIKKGLLAIPNERSSHSHPTPTGGGVAIVVSFLSGSTWLYALHILPSHLYCTLLVGGVLLGGICFLDDIREVSPYLRLCVQCLSAGLAIFLLGAFKTLDIGHYTWQLGWLAYPITFVVIIWFINLFNFMDGIDGIAVSEAICYALVGLLICQIIHDRALQAAFALLVASCLGFGLWNWPPAKIFMGDTGSSFLGYCIAILMLATHQTDQLSIWPFIIIFGLFICDATITLIRRIVNGEKWHTAHRSHAYQKLSRRWKSHKRVTVTLCIINIVWLAPLSLLSIETPGYALEMMLVAFVPLVIGMIYLKAGLTKPNKQ